MFFALPHGSVSNSRPWARNLALGEIALASSYGVIACSAMPLLPRPTRSKRYLWWSPGRSMDAIIPRNFAVAEANLGLVTVICRSWRLAYPCVV